MSKVILLFALPPLQSIISSPVSCHGRLWEQCGSLPVLGNLTFAGWGQDSVSSALFVLCVSLHGVFHRNQQFSNFQSVALVCITLTMMLWMHHVNFIRSLCSRLLDPFLSGGGHAPLHCSSLLEGSCTCPFENPWIVSTKGIGLLCWTGLAVNFRLCWPSFLSRRFSDSAFSPRVHESLSARS